MRVSSPRPRVFLAHARGDQEDVRNLCRRLTRDGVRAWLDQEKLLPGEDWDYEIRKAVRASQVVIVCLSKKFNRQRGYRQKEVRIALEEAERLPEGRIFIIPARLEACELPESLRRWQRVDLYEVDGYRKLLQALRKRSALTQSAA
jgi:hypothetical protein